MNGPLRWQRFWFDVWLFGMALGTYLSLRPGSAQEAWFPQADKLIHASGYAVLAVFAVCLYRPTLTRLKALLWLLFLGGAIEIAQGLWAVNRSMELADLVADGMGIALGAALCWRRNLLAWIEKHVR